MDYTFEIEKHSFRGLELTIRSDNTHLLVPLSGADLWRLARLGMKAAEMGKLEDAVPPLLVYAHLPYSDFDTDQSTEAYHWAVLVDSLDTARVVQAAVNAELEKTESFKRERAGIEPLPGRLVVEEHMGDPVGGDPASLAGVIADLRWKMFSHQSDSIHADVNYWLACGFTADEIYENRLELADLADAAEYEDDPAEMIREYEAGTREEDWTEPSWLKFKAWAAGSGVVSADAS